MRKKILVVEDDRDVAELVKLVLETDSFIVETVLDPEMAYDKAKESAAKAIEALWEAVEAFRWRDS